MAAARGATVVRRATLYISYFGVTEALVESQVLTYLGEIVRHDVEVHLLTFEQQPPTAEDEARIASRLLARGIRWHWRRYHQRPSLPATAYDVLVGSIAALQICRRHHIRLVHARSHVPAAMGLFLKRVLGCKLLFDLRGLLADEYVDAGRWSPEDVKFRLTKRLEHRCYDGADALVVLTERIKTELRESEPFSSRSDEDITVIPCCVDAARFREAADRRASVRQKMGWSSRTVLTYVGSIGTRYQYREMAEFFAAMRRLDPGSFFNVLTLNDARSLEAELAGLGVGRDDYAVAKVSPADVPPLVAASDAGICFLRGTASRASSPTKIGEYFAAGVPVVTNRWGGDYEDAIARGELGVVVPALDADAYRESATRLRTILADERVRGRCRAFAERELSLETVGGPRYAAVYERLFAGEPDAEASPRCRESA
jgi:glycosyltransferase involved in cell wall biosynthesis